MLTLPYNKRMQSDHPIRYANGLAADARRYVHGSVVSSKLNSTPGELSA